MEDDRSPQGLDLAYSLYDGTDPDAQVAPRPPVVILHAILDGKDSWSETAARLSDGTVREVYVLDARNHGDSPRTENCHLEENVRDVDRFLTRLGQPAVLIGHSYGGMVAMKLALEKPRLVLELIVMDISPLRMPQHEEELVSCLCSYVGAFLRRPAGNGVPDVHRRDLANYIQDNSLRKIVLSNLVEEEGRLRWKVNADAVNRTVGRIKRSYPLRGRYSGRTLFVHGDSNYIIQSEYEEVTKLFPKAQMVRLEKCGHWIHVDKPDELTQLLIQHLSH